MTIPLETLGLQILGFDEYPKFLSYLPFSKKCQVSKLIIKSALSIKICSVELF